ncbi:MAG: hypothetical protein J3Q66DRAFT_368576 [Benniella sp.]|nr:MAG: hypothetical protein J3Q66DRAFT_368576 [Benniella sp.]
MPSKQRICGQPAIKIFQDNFKFFYVKLEPGHEFQKAFEDEVSSFLTIMRRSSLPAVRQSHSWPNMLALLDWMMDVILTYRVWMLTGNVRDPDMEAQLEDEANRLADYQ